MKVLFTMLLVIFSLTGYSQKLDYTRKYLKTIVRRQMVEIEQLKAENGKLKKSSEEERRAVQAKYAEVNSKEQKGKIDCENELFGVKLDLRVRDNELAERTKEKQNIQLAMEQYKRQVEILANQVADLKIATPQVSVRSYALPEREAEYSPARRTYSSPGKSYITGPRGGCYYINGNKTYVDRSLCR